jgi:hypothetical protein
MTIKLTEEQLARYGCTTQEEIIAALDKSIEKPKPPEPPAAPPAPAPAAQDPLVAGLQALSVKLGAVETSLATLSPETIVASAATEAKRVASLEVSAAIARAGGNALAQKSDPADPAPGGKKEIAPTDYAGQFDADAKIREEFIEKSIYVAYMKGCAAGRVRSSPLTVSERN